MPCKDKDSITLVSDNKAYQPFKVPESEKSAIALVLGAIILEYDRFKRERIARRAIQKEKKRIQCNAMKPYIDIVNPVKVDLMTKFNGLLRLEVSNNLFIFVTEFGHKCQKLVK